MNNPKKPSSESFQLQGRNILVMGLGQHGGGVATIKYLVKKGAHVVCTDLKSHWELKKSVRELSNLNLHFVLGEHRPEDFDNADLIVKNPDVPAHSPWLKGRNNIETDLSIFLRFNKSPLIAVTGTKGKSTTVTLLHQMMKRLCPDAKLGGNIKISPLTFLDELTGHETVILELSSWQLHDLKGRGLLSPDIAIITNLMRDHQDKYTSFEDYESDKRIIYQEMDHTGTAIFPDDKWGHKWASEFKGQSYFVLSEPPVKRLDSVDGSDLVDCSRLPGAILNADGSGWFCPAGKINNIEALMPASLPVPGPAFRTNALFASLALKLWFNKKYGLPGERVRNQQQKQTERNRAKARRKLKEALLMKDCKSAPHRMELFLESGGIQFYNDTSASIPEATAAAVLAMDRPFILIAGGQDKELDFRMFDKLCRKPECIVMLGGSATDKWFPQLQKAGARLCGPVNSMQEAVAMALEQAKAGYAVLLSPGAASFGLFRNIFHRGDEFKKACKLLSY